VSARKTGIPVYILASNLLAGEYILKVLEAARFARPVLCKRLPQARVKSIPTVFVVEDSAVPLPLSDCVRRLSSVFPKARFVMVDKPRSHEEMVRIIQMGFHAFVEHSQVSRCLAEAVRAVVNGHIWPNELIDSFVHSSTESSAGLIDKPRHPTLRETEVLELIRQRMSNKEIAEVLEVSENTVKYHVRKLFSKLGAASRRELEKHRSDVWEQIASLV
jgi:DNA-binding NarL/FixJ family response regulator